MLKIKNFYSNLSIKYKILLFFWLIILLLSTFLGLYSYTLSKNMVTQRAYTDCMKTVQQINNNIQFVQQDFFDALTLISIDKPSQKLFRSAKKLSEQSVQDYDFIKLQQDSVQSIVNLTLSTHYISRMVMYSDTYEYPLSAVDKVYTIPDRKNKPLSQLSQTDEYSEIVSANCHIEWFISEPGETFFSFESKERQLIAAKLVKDLVTQKPIGILIAASDEHLFRQCYSSLLDDTENKVIILGAQNELLSCNDPSFYDYITSDKALLNNINQNHFSELVNTTEGLQLITSFCDNKAGWTVIFSLPYDNVIGEITHIKWFTVALIIISFLLAIPLTMLIFRPISKSINQLLEAINRFKKGDFNATITPYYQDELGRLSIGYNEMTKEIQSLITNVYISNIQKKNAELKALEAQINPHFLYNTLEIMMAKAERQKNLEIVEMIYSLARFFRLSLNRGQEQTTIANEKELLEHYLTLQKIRYNDKLTYHISIDEDLLSVIIPKLILQPFVENSIIHGITPQKEKGLISVLGYKKDTNITFEIIDTGIGMSEEQYQELMYSLDNNIEYNTEHNGGYALYNVKKRLELAYGEEGYRLDISTKYMKGTHVKITLYNTFTQKENPHDKALYR